MQPPGPQLEVRGGSPRRRIATQTDRGGRHAGAQDQRLVNLKLKALQYFAAFNLFPVYNEVWLSLTHTQLKVGIANQRHPLSLAANLLSTIQKVEKRKHNGRNRNSKVV